VGLTALQTLRKLELARGETLVVLNASGGVGSIAVQLAVDLGANVIGVASSRNADYVRSLGASETLDYTAGPLPEQLRQVAPEGAHAVADFIGGDALAAAPSLLRSGVEGRFCSVVDPAVKEAGGRYVFVRPDAEQLADLVGKVDSGALRLEIEEALPLSKAATAHERIESHRTRGKLVLTV
jgi:NADPH:quinone reductase-like Zn-dependent oxidoreductase